MKYETYTPDESIAACVRCFWTLESEAGSLPTKQTIVPDGCMEMIFHLGDPYRQYLPDGTCLIQPNHFVIGQLTHPLVIEPTGNTKIFAVRFVPDGFLPFTEMPLNEFENKAVSIEKIVGTQGTWLATQVHDASDVWSRIQILTTFLSNTLSEKQTTDRLVKIVVQNIVTANGLLSVHELTTQQQINRRQLERKFAKTIGLSPKQLSKMIRMQSALKILVSSPDARLIDGIQDGAYYDQAHFIRDFREFTGQSPKSFYSDHMLLSKLFIAAE